MSLRDAVLRDYEGDQVILVSDITDLPAPSGGVITLADNKTYKIMGTVDISPNRIVCGIRNSVIGEDRLNDVLTSNTTGALFTATTGALVLVCNTLTMQAASGSVFDFNAVSLSVSECSPKGATLGTFTNALTVTFRQSGMISAYTIGGATFTGTCSALRVFDNVISGNAGTLFALGTCVFDNVYIDRNRATLSAGQTFLSGAAGGANVTTAGILANNIFSGAGTYVSTITGSDVKWLWTANVGVTNTPDTAAAWGSITGTLSSQTDLQAALDAKQGLDTQLTSLAGLSYASNALKVVRVNAGESAFELATPTGGSASATTVEIDLGSTAKWSGRFTITDAAISATNKVLCWQAPGAYTGKGTRADEAEMQPVNVVTVNPGAGSATVYWQTPPMLAMTVDTQPGGTLNAVGATFDRLTNQLMPKSVSFKRIGLVRGNVKFSYMILS